MKFSITELPGKSAPKVNANFVYSTRGLYKFVYGNNIGYILCLRERDVVLYLCNDTIELFNVDVWDGELFTPMPTNQGVTFTP